MMLNIVFQNENFIICDKPAEVLSVPARDTNDARLCLGLELQNKLKQQIFPVHRLDFEVSGLIMYALNKQSHRQSQKWFENKKIQKKYIAKTSRQDFKHWPPELKNDRQVLELHLDIPFYWRTQIMRGKRRAFETENGDWAETKALLNHLFSISVLNSVFNHFHKGNSNPFFFRVKTSFGKRSSNFFLRMIFCSLRFSFSFLSRFS